MYTQALLHSSYTTCLLGPWGVLHQFQFPINLHNLPSLAFTVLKAETQVQKPCKVEQTFIKDTIKNVNHISFRFPQIQPHLVDA